MSFSLPIVNCPAGMSTIVITEDDAGACFGGSVSDRVLHPVIIIIARIAKRYSIARTVLLLPVFVFITSVLD